VIQLLNIPSYANLSYAQATDRIYSTHTCCPGRHGCTHFFCILRMTLLRWICYRASVSGDKQVRIFDVHRCGTDSREAGYHTRDSCLRIFKCHASRVKRIMTEDSPDSFLTVSEASFESPSCLLLFLYSQI
jgi:hypothetical protein